MLCSALLGSLVATAAPVGSIDAPYSHLAEGQHISLGVSVGPDFLLAYPGQAWKPGLDLGALVDVPFGEEAGVSFEFDHSLHRMDDATVMFQNLEGVDPDVVTGTQRLMTLDAGLRLGLLLIDETRINPRKVVAIPWFRIAMGVAFTDTILAIPTFSGQEQLRTRQPFFMVDPGLGVAVHVARPLTLQPSVKAVMLMALDHNEVENNDTVRAEWMVQPGLDIMTNF